MFTLLILLGMALTAVWVGVDAGQRDWTGDKFANSPTKWVVGTVLCWAIVFPVYLHKRGRAPLKA